MVNRPLELLDGSLQVVYNKLLAGVTFVSSWSLRSCPADCRALKKKPLNMQMLHDMHYRPAILIALVELGPEFD